MRRSAIVALLAAATAAAQPGHLRATPMRERPEGAPMEPALAPDARRLMCNLRPHDDCVCTGLPAGPGFGRRRVRLLLDALRNCYERALQRPTPELTTPLRIVLRIEIAPSGRVQHAQAIEGADRVPELAACFASTVRAVRFAPTSGSVPAVVEIPITLSTDQPRAPSGH